ncbi:hypothetical protein SJ05684_c18310 [Sinorhizobium sojae CCBAU 05684]|uniref:Uncharacterized protein n=1 Tax=Sinorhizobium sojae CCBAU 05684 TaxID=716928 RepID=A0A249PBH6_9HYPH|nr:hypothetical protein SJ05684_c18310 [Sinorhizobium sojae CCBAU 05684]
MFHNSMIAGRRRSLATGLQLQLLIDGLSMITMPVRTVFDA